MASTDENPGLLARFYGSRQESSTRRKSAERPFPHNVQRGSTAATTAANCLYPDTTRGRRNVRRSRRAPRRPTRFSRVLPSNWRSTTASTTLDSSEFAPTAG